MVDARGFASIDAIHFITSSQDKVLGAGLVCHKHGHFVSHSSGLRCSKKIPISRQATYWQHKEDHFIHTEVLSYVSSWTTKVQSTVELEYKQSVYDLESRVTVTMVT